MTLPKTMYPGMVNSPETTITNNINELDTIIYVLDPTRVPIPPNLMTLGTGTNAETVKVLEINDNTITVERGFQGIAKSWPAGTVIARNFTEYDYSALKDNIEDLDASKETPAGAQAKADAAEAAAKAYADQEVAEVSQALDAHVAAAAPHSGHETPAGAQAKAEAAAGAVQAELDAHVADKAAHMSDEEKAYWLDKWALLDPNLISLQVGPSWSLTVPSGEYRYVLGSWGTKINDGGRMEIRNPFRPFLLPGGATIAATGESSGAHALILNPFGATPPANPKKTYYDRLKRLKELQLFSISTSSNSGVPQGNFDAPFPSDFENGLVVAIHVFDGAWVGLSDFTTHSLNLNNEISDSHQIRFSNTMYLPFKRSIHPGIRSRNARVDGAIGNNSDLASVCTVLYYKLPPDW